MEQKSVGGVSQAKLETVGRRIRWYDESKKDDQVVRTPRKECLVEDCPKAGKAVKWYVCAGCIEGFGGFLDDNVRMQATPMIPMGRGKVRFCHTCICRVVKSETDDRETREERDLRTQVASAKKRGKKSGEEVPELSGSDDSPGEDE
jgi:hypothetical protein